MTIWTDIQDKVTGYRKYSGGDTLTTQDGRVLLTQDGKELTKQGRESAFVDGVDSDTNWGFFGGLIRLVTEGYREELMTEGNIDYLVYSHGEDKEIWTDTNDIPNSWTKISDI